MRIAITAGLGARSESTIDGLAERAQELEARGFAGMWLPNAFGFDAITALATAGRSTTRIEIGTAVVPTFPRHPVVMAQQALTAQDALKGRFTLGIGLSHKVMMEDQLGIPYEKPARHMREYLQVLAPLLHGEPAAFEGEQYRTHAAVAVPGATRVPLLVAALGDAMLGLAGTYADGTITSWVGPKTLAKHIVPRISAAAKAGRAAPRHASPSDCPSPSPTTLPPRAQPSANAPPGTTRCRPTAPCSISKASPTRPTSPSLATKPRSTPSSRHSATLAPPTSSPSSSPSVPAPPNARSTTSPAALRFQRQHPRANEIRLLPASFAC
jgi:F420-dependent oxidoreductase-like protein